MKRQMKDLHKTLIMKRFLTSFEMTVSMAIPRKAVIPNKTKCNEESLVPVIATLHSYSSDDFESSDEYPHRKQRSHSQGFTWSEALTKHGMRDQFLALLLCLSTLSVFAQKQGKPVLTKLPFAFSGEGRTPMENTPFEWGDRLLIVANYRPGGAEAKGKDAYLYIDDLQNGMEIARFGVGHSFVSAFVNGNELNVFALEFTDFGRVMNSTGIDRMVSSDLKNWKTEKAILPEGGEHLFNSSVCRDGKGYVMAYESDKPVQFCFKFARSNDLSKWEKISGLAFTGEKREYSACPVIRYFAPYYYVIYLHAPKKGHNGWISYMVRSKDLEHWEFSPYNPILEAGAGEGKNNSDVDILEYQGKTYLYYATGDQETWGTVRVAQSDGSEKDFFESYFPGNTKLTTVSAKQ